MILCPVDKSIQVLYSLQPNIALLFQCLTFTDTLYCSLLFRYICSIEENAKEGTKLVFEGGLDKVEDPDKVFI